MVTIREFNPAGLGFGFFIAGSRDSSPGPAYVFIPEMQGWILRDAPQFHLEKVLDDGSKYMGDSIAGICWHGRGTLVSPDGIRYDGTFRYGRRVGRGRMTASNGSMREYEGNWEDDRPEGHGRALYSNGSVYDGEWRKGVRCGWGRLDMPGAASYEGEWKEDAFHGWGRFESGNDVFTGTYCMGARLTGKLVSVSPEDGSTHTYEGEFQAARAHGEGLLVVDEGQGRVKRIKGSFKDGHPNGYVEAQTFPTGLIYRGTMQDGLRSGRGALYHVERGQEALVYKGEFKTDLYEGEGELHMADGSIHVGRFSEGRAQGPGVRRYPDGGLFEGTWAAGEKEGPSCKETLASGEVYVGPFVKGKRHGRGRCVFADGAVFEGEFEEGEWVQTEGHPGKTKIILPDPLLIKAGEPLSLRILPHDASGNPRLSGGDIVTVSAVLEQQTGPLYKHGVKAQDGSQGTEKIDFTVTDHGDGTYTASAPLATSGLYQISATLGRRSKPIAGSPWRLFVAPSEPCLRGFEALWLQPRNRVLAGPDAPPYDFLLIPHDTYGNPYPAGGHSVLSPLALDPSPPSTGTSPSGAVPTPNPPNPSNGSLPADPVAHSKSSETKPIGAPPLLSGLSVVIRGSSGSALPVPVSPEPFHNLNVSNSSVIWAGRCSVRCLTAGPYRIEATWQGKPLPGWPHPLEAQEAGGTAPVAMPAAAGSGVATGSFLGTPESNGDASVAQGMAQQMEDCCLSAPSSSEASRTPTVLTPPQPSSGPIPPASKGLFGKNWDQIAREAFLEVDGSIDGFEEDARPQFKSEAERERAKLKEYARANPSAMIVERSEDLWKALKLSEEKKKKDKGQGLGQGGSVAGARAAAASSPSSVAPGPAEGSGSGLSSDLQDLESSKSRTQAPGSKPATDGHGASTGSATPAAPRAPISILPFPVPRN